MKSFERDRGQMLELAARLKIAGLADDRLAAAFASVPRRLFLSAPYQGDAYEDQTLPIECGQVTMAPSTMASVVTALQAAPEHKVLEVGCGGGFQAAVLSKMVRQVVTLDRFRTLVALAEDRLSAMKIANVVPLVADGLEGFTRHAPTTASWSTARCRRSPVR